MSKQTVYKHLDITYEQRQLEHDRLTIEVVTLYKHAVITDAPDPRPPPHPLPTTHSDACTRTAFMNSFAHSEATVDLPLLR